MPATKKESSNINTNTNSGNIACLRFGRGRQWKVGGGRKGAYRKVDHIILSGIARPCKHTLTLQYRLYCKCLYDAISSTLQLHMHHNYMCTTATAPTCRSLMMSARLPPEHSSISRYTCVRVTFMTCDTHKPHTRDTHE